MAELTGLLAERLGVETWSGDPEAGAWVAGVEIWGGLVPVEGGPVGAGEGRVSRPRYRLTIRTRAVSLATRFRWRGRVLAVLRLEPDPRLPDRTTLTVEDRG